MCLVVFVGGCTLAEVSALRTMSLNENRNSNALTLDKRRYVVLTTGIINGDRILESLIQS